MPLHAKSHAKSIKRSGKVAAKRADRHELYERAVQDAEAEVDFVDETFESISGRRANLLREDFCGTANTSCEWVRRRKTNTAIAIDLDEEVLEWGRKRHVKALGKASDRVTLMLADVNKVKTPPVDIVLAHNFSYWLFKERATLKRYFERVRKALGKDGVFFLDAYGGYEAFMETREKTHYPDFTYVWEQASYNPVNGDMRCHIHFHFPDGSKLKRAFTYEWRLWTLPEVRELLAEAGFSRTTVYWEGSDEGSDEGNGVFMPTEVGDADAGWIVYLTAQP